MFGSELAVDVVEVGPEIVEIGRAEKRAEGAAYDALGLRQVLVRKRSYVVRHLLLPFFGTQTRLARSARARRSLRPVRPLMQGER